MNSARKRAVVGAEASEHIATIDSSSPATRPLTASGGGNRRRPPTAVGTLPEPRRVGPFVLPDRAICGNGRASGIGRGKLVQEARKAAQLVAGEYRGQRFAVGRVGVIITVQRNPLWAARRLDDDSLIRGCKPIFDALQDAGIVGDDRQLFIAGAVVWTPPGMPGGVWLTLTQAT